MNPKFERCTQRTWHQPILESNEEENENIPLTLKGDDCKGVKMWLSNIDVFRKVMPRE
jgi:hypothetical protein